MKLVTWSMLAMLLALLCPARSPAEQRYTVDGLVLSVDKPHQKLTVSCREIPGFMDAMVMPFAVRDGTQLRGLTRGTLVEFTLVVTKESSYADAIRIRGYDSAEREPSEARRLRALDNALGGPSQKVLAPGQMVPDFELIDQQNRPVRLNQFKGKVILLNFVYTRCALPDYCFRLSNNFGVVQKREHNRLGRDLVLLTITFDPSHDRPEVLRTYAKTWNADPESWRFLTGTEPAVQRVCAMFGVNAFADEGLFVHSLHTAIIDRNGKLTANLEGNEFTTQQLSDLVEATLDESK